MDIHDAATLTETSLREQLTTTEAPTGEDHFALTLKRVEVEDASTLRVVFGVGMVFRLGDHRAQERINGCLRALQKTHPELRGVAFEVTAESLEPEA
jgi:hypothetical protein